MSTIGSTQTRNPKTAILAGNPNAGKTSLFNQLTGLRQKVGNYPGITVDRKTGICDLGGGEKIKITDLPGIYSFYPNSPDERIALENLFLSCAAASRASETVIYVADACQLMRHLLLFSQIADLKLPLILVINMLDVAKSEGISCDLSYLEKKLGIPVVAVNGRTGQGISTLKKLLKNGEAKSVQKNFLEVNTLNVSDTLSDVAQVLKNESAENPYFDLLQAHHFEWLPAYTPPQKAALRQKIQHSGFESLKLQIRETMLRYHKIEQLVASAITRPQAESVSLTEKLDRFLAHPILGVSIFFLILFLLFQAIFAWASYPMDLIDAGFAQIISFLNEKLPTHWLSALFTEGIVAGLGGIVIFVPQITILFALVAILEDIGYMSRAVFLSDYFMRKFGLNGRSVVSLISGVACAIPAIMAARTISNRKARMITIFVAPLMSCSARIPVFTVLIAFIVPQETWAGIFNLQGLAMSGLYFLGAFAAIFSAWLVKKLLKQEETTLFAIELPTYKMPHWKNVFYTVVNKVKTFLFEAGKIIIIISIALWFLASYGPGDAMEQAERIENPKLLAQNLNEEETEHLIAAQKLEASYAGILGKIIEPAIAPLGFDWKIGIALITSFAAREVFVGTMATIYNIGSSDEAEPLIQKLRTAKNPDTGMPAYNLANSLSLLLFYLFAMQCMSTIAVVYRETNSLKWTAAQLLYMSGLAYLASLLTYQLMR